MILYPGKRLDKYEILHFLGGGMARAYLAMNINLHRQCVLKVLPVSTDINSVSIKREAQMLYRSGQHPSLPLVYTAFTHQQIPFIVMQYIEGKDLQSLVLERKTPFDVARVVEWSQGLLDALDHIHNRPEPIFHLDIKPSNISIVQTKNKERVVLLDFGIACLLREINAAPGALTPGYAPIEQYPLDHFREDMADIRVYIDEHVANYGIGPHTDIYALGATLYYALTLEVPPPAPVRVRSDKLTPIQELNSEVPDRLATVIMCALNLDPKERFSSASEMQKALFTQTAVLSGAPSDLPRVSFFRSLRVWIQQPLHLLGVVAVMVLLFIVSILGLNTVCSQQEDLLATPGRASFLLRVASFCAVVSPSPTEAITPTLSPSSSPIPTLTPSLKPSLSPIPSTTPSLTPTPLPIPSANPTATPHAFPFEVKVAELTIRAGPGHQYLKLRTVHRGAQVQVVGRLQDGTWWKVNIMGQLGWIPAQPARVEDQPDLLPVVTPPASAPLEPPTATPMPICEIQPAGEFAVAWREPNLRLGLGCPHNQEYKTYSAYQDFENGSMYWREDTDMIYVLYDNGTWQEFPDLWTEGQEERVGYTAPAGLQEPKRGFGRVWRENLGGPNAALGWAKEEEKGQDTQIQDFANGVLLKLNAKIHILMSANQTWKFYSPGMGIPSPTAIPLPQISPESLPLRLAFVLGYRETADIWTIEADGSNPQLFIGEEGDQSEPDWSSDGTRLVYQSDQPGNFDIWLVDAYGQSPRALTTDAIDEFEPHFSPDGMQIVYRYGGERFGDGELRIMDINGGRQRSLGATPVLGRVPVWSPDGTKIAFMSDRGGTWDIYVLDLETDKVRRFTSCATHCRFPEWSPNGEYIVYSVTESVDSFTSVRICQRRLDWRLVSHVLFEGNGISRLTWSTEGVGAFNSETGIMVFDKERRLASMLPNTNDGWACDWSR